MLFSIGPLVFDLVNNVHEYDVDDTEDFARKDVIGARKPFEHSGPGDERLMFKGKLFPEKLGGAGALDALKAIKSSATPQVVIRGDGRFFGWFLVTKLHHTGSYLAADGAPRMIDVDVTLERTDAPSATAAFSALVELFG